MPFFFGKRWQRGNGSTGHGGDTARHMAAVVGAVAVSKALRVLVLERMSVASCSGGGAAAAGQGIRYGTRG